MKILILIIRQTKIELVQTGFVEETVTSLYNFSWDITFLSYYIHLL